MCGKVTRSKPVMQNQLKKKKAGTAGVEEKVKSLVRGFVVQGNEYMK